MVDKKSMSFAEERAMIDADPLHQATEILPNTFPDWAKDLPTSDSEGRGRAVVIRVEADGYVGVWTSWNDPAYTVELLAEIGRQVTMMMARGLTDE